MHAEVRAPQLILQVSRIQYLQCCVLHYSQSSSLQSSKPQLGKKGWTR